METDPELFEDGIESGDVIQGALGDCWFLGAMSALSTRPELLQSVFVTPKDRSAQETHVFKSDMTTELKRERITMIQN